EPPDRSVTPLHACLLGCGVAYQRPRCALQDDPTTRRALRHQRGRNGRTTAAACENARFPTVSVSKPGGDGYVRHVDDSLLVLGSERRRSRIEPLALPRDVRRTGVTKTSP